MQKLDREYATTKKGKMCSVPLANICDVVAVDDEGTSSSRDDKQTFLFLTDRRNDSCQFIGRRMDIPRQAFFRQVPIGAAGDGLTSIPKFKFCIMPKTPIVLVETTIVSHRQTSQERGMEREVASEAPSTQQTHTLRSATTHLRRPITTNDMDRSSHSCGEDLYQKSLDLQRQFSQLKGEFLGRTAQYDDEIVASATFSDGMCFLRSIERFVLVAPLSHIV